MSSEPGSVHAALSAGYRIVVHASFFPYESISGLNPKSSGTFTVHAEVDHGARAIFCSQEWFDKCREVAK